jgi:hypothetical protein
VKVFQDNVLQSFNFTVSVRGIGVVTEKKYHFFFVKLVMTLKNDIGSVIGV